MIRQVVVPGFDPSFVTRSETVRVPLSAVTPTTSAEKGPIPATAQRATSARTTIARPTATKTVPWTCELAESLSPSGLQRSHRPTSSATGAPQRAHGCVSSGGVGRAAEVEVGGYAIGPSIVPRTGPRGGWQRRRAGAGACDSLPAIDRADEGVDVVGRPGGQEDLVGARLEPARQLLSWRDDEWVAATTDRRPSDGAHRTRGRPADRSRRDRPLPVPRGSVARGRGTCRTPPPSRRRARRRCGRRPACPAPMRIGGGGSGTGWAYASRSGYSALARVAGPPVHRARSTATASRRWAARSGGCRERDPVCLVLVGMAADPDPEHEPAPARLLERRCHPGEDRRVAVHDVGDERADA